MGCKNISTPADFDLQVHRGCRGLMPENSIPAFIKALELGVNTLEMDVLISADKMPVVTHDPYISPIICTKSNGESISEEEKFPIYQLSFSEIKEFDCGSKGNPFFPTQQTFPVHLPLLSEVIEVSEKYCVENKRPLPWYNIETKTNSSGDNTLHPEPEEFVNILYRILEDYDVLDRVIIQSFDIRTLQEMKKLNPEIKLALLVENELSPEINISALGFIPEIYSPHYHLVNEQLIEFCKAQNMKVIPWTVNTRNEMQHLINLGVDGIITDYPNHFPDK